MLDEPLLELLSPIPPPEPDELELDDGLGGGANVPPHSVLPKGSTNSYSNSQSQHPHGSCASGISNNDLNASNRIHVGVPPHP